MKDKNQLSVEIAEEYDQIIILSQGTEYTYKYKYLEMLLCLSDLWHNVSAQLNLQEPSDEMYDNILEEYDINDGEMFI